MREVLHQYFNIAFLMGKPQDLPSGTTQLRFGILLAVGTYVMALVVPFGIERAVLQALIDISVTALLLWLGLALVGRTGRFVQAFGGLCGASAFINLAAMPLYMTRPTAMAEAGATVGTLPDFILLVWGLSLFAHIIRHTFEVKLVISILISFFFFLLLSMAMATLMPLPAAVIEEPVSCLSVQPAQKSCDLAPNSLVTAFELVASSTRML